MANKTISIDLLIETAKSVKSTEAQKSILLDIYEALKKVEKGSPAFDNLTKSADALKESLGGVGATFEDIYGDLKPLSARLGEMEDRMYELALAGQQNTQEFKDLQAEAIKMRSTIIDVDASVDAFAQKGAKLNAFVGTLSGIAGGFAVIQGSMALLGSENEDLEKGLLKVQSALAVLNGLQEINRLITEKNIIVQRILNVVMKANPIFILIGVLTAVTAAWVYFTNSVEDNTKSLKKQKDASDKTITNIDKEIERNKKLGLSIDDLRKKRQDAYNEQLIILKQQLEEEKKVLNETVNEFAVAQGFMATNKLGGYLYQLVFGGSKDDLQKGFDAIDEVQNKIKDVEALIITDKEDAANEIINTELARLERERTLAEAYGKDTIALDRAIIEEKKKLYDTNSDDYKDLINERKILDITYNRDLKDRLDEQRQLWEDALNDISDFNINEGFVITEEQIQSYSDSIYKLVELRKLQGEEAVISINKEYDAQIKAANDALANDKKLGQNKVEYTKRFNEAIQTAEDNRLKRLENNTEKTERDITSIIEDEAEKRKKLLESYTKDVLSPDEYQRFVEFNKITLDRWEKTGLTTINDLELYIKNVRKEARISREGVKDITEDQLKGITNVIRTSIGESEKALDLLDDIYDNKSSVILKTIADINKELKDPKTQEALTFSLKPKEGEIGLEELVKIDPDAVKKLGDALNDEFDDLRKKEEASFSEILFDRYKQYKVDISQLDLTEKEKAKIRKEYIKDTENIEEDHNDKMLIIDLAYGKASQADLVEYFKKKNATIEEENQKEKDVKQKLNEQLITLEQQLQDATMSIYNNIIDQKLAANQRLYDDTIEKIDAEENAFNEQFITRTALEQAKYDAELSFQAKRDNAERKRQLEEDKLNRKRFNAQKANDLATVTINTAIAVSKTVAELGGVGAITPPGAALVAGVIAGGAIQAGSIAAQKYIPAYAKGGLVRGPGTGTSDSIDAKLSNGEVVINQKSATAFAPLLDAINQAGGGVAIPYAKKPMKPMSSSEKYDFNRLEDAIMGLNDRPIETYITEKSVTESQLRAKKMKDRTRF